MKITQVSSPNAVQHTQATDNRAKAIEAFNKGQSSYDKHPQQQAQEHPVQNPSNVAVEELAAIQAPGQPTEIIDNNILSEDTNVAVESSTAPEAEVKPKKDPETERQFAELARQTRMLRARALKQEQDFRDREEALKSQEAAIAARADEYKQGYISKDRLKADTLSVLAEEGLSYDELTQQLLNQQPRDPRMEARMDRLEAENRALRQANEDSQKSYKEQQAESYRQAVKQIESDALKLVKSDPAAYEAIVKTGSVKDVVELIEQTWKKDGVLLTVEEASEEVENYLVEEGVNTISRIDKIKKRIAQSSATTGQETKTQATPKQTQQAPMKTLTNATSSTRKLSARERALLAFKGELKS